VAAGRLVICPTPIGNLEDVTLRVLSALREADVVACEDTRRTRVLLDRYGVKASLVSYHEHNERSRAGELVGRMREGAVVALVSDAGMPLISDPGFELVRACVAAGLPVEVLPGPSAALAALVASDLPVSEYTALQMKKAIVGHGQARKEQVQEMVMRLLKLPGLPGKDAADALGLAICHAHAGASFAAIERSTSLARKSHAQYKRGRSY
jgi:16S rRNA (cytidine(1402)-2'-O)-methyltransferase